MFFKSAGPLLDIRFLEEGGKGICGPAVAGGAWFCMSYSDECNTDSYTRSRGLRYDLPGGKGGTSVVLEPSALRLLEFSFY